jgi:hypothetical protein
MVDGPRSFACSLRLLSVKTVAIPVCLFFLAACPLLGAIKLVVREGRPFVDGVFVNGHGPYRFMVDTGASMDLIDASIARKIGMAPSFHDDVESAVGKISLPGSDGNIVELGPVRADHQRFQFSTLDTIHVLWWDVRGVLGQSFLRRFDYKIDLKGQRLEFGKQLPEGSRARSKTVDGRTMVPTSLGDLVLDSGAARLVLFGVAPNMRDLSDMLTVTGRKAVGMVTSRLVISGRNIWRGDAVAIPDNAEPGVAGLMPLSLFNTIYVSNSESYVEFN